MQPQITVVLPVRNSAGTISRRLTEMLEIVPGIATNFELLVIDDASTDATSEVTAEFATRYPQVNLLRHRDSHGMFSAIRTGCNAATGKSIFVQEPEQAISPQLIAQFVASGAPNNLMEVSRRHPVKSVDDDLIGRLSQWCVALKEERENRAAQISDDTGKRVDNAEQPAALPNLIKNSGSIFSNDATAET